MQNSEIETEKRARYLVTITFQRERFFDEAPEAMDYAIQHVYLHESARADLRTRLEMGVPIAWCHDFQHVSIKKLK